MNIPTHVAIILDGNRRWAKEKNLPTFEGHRRGLNQTIEISKKAKQMGIKILTVWGFSTENWDRPKKEVDYLMNLFESWISENLKEAVKEETRIIHLGRKDRFSKKLRDRIIESEEKTKAFSKHYLCIALDYGGRDELLRAINKLPENFKLIEKFLDTKDLPQSDVDLIIRTGGEQRMSGFMIWQGAYAEYVFVKKYLPDFTTEDFEDCIEEYGKRKRRFGK
jgi:undecaprenyl diphosphate synthase